jgi:DNA recombination protein RmuC
MNDAVLLVFVAVAALAAVGAVAAAFRFWTKNQTAGRDEAGMRLLQQQLDALRSQLSESLSSQAQLVNQQLGLLTTQMGQRLDSVAREVNSSQKAVGERLDNAARVVGEVQKSLGALGQASDRIFEVGKDIAGLQEILRAPKLRGGLGEFLLEDLLGQILPAKHFQTQHVFKNGCAVDAVIRLGGKWVPVDAKFPLENFRRVAECKTDEERRPLQRKFAMDVKKHIDAIANKYILPDEGTFDFALMYIPAENVYYEVVVKDENAGEAESLSAYALQRRVVPVSPNSFFAYLQAILFGLRGFQIEENARVIMQNLARLQGDLVRFLDDFELVGKHLSNTRAKYEDAEKRLGRFQEKLAELNRGELPPRLTETPSAISVSEQ